jgi:hypothetical protein
LKLFLVGPLPPLPKSGAQWHSDCDGPAPLTLLTLHRKIFFKDSWRIFDGIIVVISLVSVSGTEAPGVKAFRAMRVLRAVRLLRKSKSLRPIVEALLASAKPVMHSMVLLGLITSIYASMAVGKSLNDVRMHCR